MVQPVSGGDLPIGTVLDGTYRIDGLIGRGGMGAVYRASHARLPGKHVAVKVLLTDVSTGSESYQRFRREAEIATRIGHPNIVQVLDWNTLPTGQPYLVLELLEGESLAKRLTRGAIPLPAALDIARQTGSALSAAHRASVVHRDLKPDNIFLVPMETGGTIGEMVKVLDFGISKMRGSTTIQTQEAQILGTPQYMSPEQASGKNKAIDERTDVFALGAIVYEMLSGRAAFSGDNLAQVVFKVVFEEAEPLATIAPHVPPDVVAAVNRALAKDPAGRFPDVASFVAALTGRPLQTLDRKAVTASQDAFAATMAPGSGSGSASLGIAATAASGPQSLTPQASGQMIAPTASPVMVTQKTGGSKKALILGGAVVAAAAGAIVAVMVMKGNGKTTTVAGGVDPTVSPVASPASSPVASPSPVASASPVASVSPESSPSPSPSPVSSLSPSPSPSPTPSPSPVATKPDTTKPDTTKPDDTKPSDEPEDVRALLDDAKSALDSRDYKKAIFLAQKALRTRKAPRAHSIITLAYCGQGDLTNANASFHSVRAADRRRVKRQCKEIGGLEIGE